jgi:8-oxo-dGTP pyrophosphatase MutT (NUDIX family)
MLHEAAMLPLDVAAVRALLASGGDPLAGEPHEGGAAAVAAILRDAERGAEILFIRRAQREGDPWSGQMGLPGGRRDPSDRSLLETAVRETREEIGLDLDRVGDLVGRLEDVEVVPRGERSRGWIRPFVFELREPASELRLEPREVEEIVWASLHELRSGARDATTDWERDGVTMTFPAWDVEGRIVWGLTYRMLQPLLARYG